eukprot:545089-Prymnesium_polylepis.1
MAHCTTRLLVLSRLLALALAHESLSPPPPLPPDDVAGLEPGAMRLLAASVHAPPSHPPYPQTPAGRREAGRGMVYQRELTSTLRHWAVLLRHGSPAARERTLRLIAQLALETTLPGSETSWLATVHPVAFRKACVAGSSRSARGDGSVVESIVGLLADAPPDDSTGALALQALQALATDDPMTDADNAHALAICAAGAVPHA